jgi:YidC/Oxa1 family membrane protein insertase
MDQRNLLLAIVASLAIIFGFQFLMGELYPDRHKPQQTTETGTTTGEAVPRPAVPGVPIQAPAVDRAQVLAKSPRITIDNGAVDGSLTLRGGRIDDLKLKKFRETLDDDSPEVTLLSPAGGESPYYAAFGWVAAAGDDRALPDGDTEWRGSGNTLAPGQPVTLTWDNGEGLEFTRTISIDENYMFEVTQTVRNRGSASVSLFPYGFISRTNPPPVLGFFILHEGPIGVLGETLQEVDYDDLEDDGSVSYTNTGGWIGITDKFWLVSLIPEAQDGATGRFSHVVVDGGNRYQADFTGSARQVAPGASSSVTTHLFAGAKEVGLLDGYAEQYGIDKFDRAIDFGWFYFLTKPLFYVLIYINGQVGNFGIAILLLTVLIKLVMFPLANKSYRSMSRMKALQPEIMELRERFGDDKQRLNQEMMGLYKEKKVSPAAGCLPIAVQIPVFFALYKVLFVTIEMRHAPFFGWIQDLSAPDPTTFINLFGLLPFSVEGLPYAEFLMIGAWPLIMGISMFLQQKLNPQPPDPVQAKIFMMLPIIFTFLLARFPSGLVIYWAWNNTLSIGQQWVIMRGVAKADAAKKAATGTPKAAAAKSGKGSKKGDDEPAPADADSEDEPEAAEGKAEPKTTTSAARGKHRGRGKRRSRGGRR